MCSCPPDFRIGGYGQIHNPGCALNPANALSEARSLNLRYATETTSIHADMLELGRVLGVPYDGVSSPAGYLHGDLMPALASLRSRLSQAEEMVESGTAELIEAYRDLHRAEAVVEAAREGLRLIGDPPGNVNRPDARRRHAIVILHAALATYDKGDGDE